MSRKWNYVCNIHDVVCEFTTQEGQKQHNRKLWIIVKVGREDIEGLELGSEGQTLIEERSPSGWGVRQSVRHKTNEGLWVRRAVSSGRVDPCCYGRP